MSLAVRSPSEMETSWAIRVQAPGLRNRARLQKGVWSQARNSSFFQEWTVWEARKKEREDNLIYSLEEIHGAEA